MIGTKQRAIGYLRRSTDKQGGSLAQQLAWILKQAEGGYLLDVPADLVQRVEDDPHIISGAYGDLYIDNAISGSDIGRKAFRALLQRLQADSEVEAVLVWDRSRLGRFERNEQGLALENDIRESGRHLIFHNGVLEPRTISDGPQMEDVVSFIGWSQAGQQRVTLAEDVIRGQSKLAEDGYWCGGAAPYGMVRRVYDVRKGKAGAVLDRHRRIQSSNDERVVIMPGKDAKSRKKLKVVKWIAEEFHRGARGLHAIAKELNRQGVASPGAGRTKRDRDGVKRRVPGKWTVGTVRHIIEHPIYSGKLPWGRHGFGSIRRFDKTQDARYRKVENHERIKGTNKARKEDIRDPDRYLLVDPKVTFKPIVPLGVWEANRALLEQRAKRGKQRGKPRASDPNAYPVNVVCGDCGHRMAGQNRGKYRIYRCSTHVNSHNTECHQNWVRRDSVVLFVLDTVRKWVSKLKVRQTLEEEIRKVLAESEDQRTDLEREGLELETRIKALREQADAVGEMMLEAKMSKDAEGLATAERLWAKRHASLNEAIERQRRVESELSILGIGGEDEVEEALSYLDGFDRFLATIPDDQLRRLMDLLGAKMVVNFQDNPDEKARRLRVPVGGELTLSPQNEPRPPEESDGLGIICGSGGRI